MKGGFFSRVIWLCLIPKLAVKLLGILEISPGKSSNSEVNVGGKKKKEETDFVDLSEIFVYLWNKSRN